MIRNSRSLIAVFLSLLILVTSGAMASARGQMRDATGAVVLCLGGVSATVMVDRNGEPVEPAHICPDCALAALDAVSQTPALAARDVGVRQIEFWKVFETGLGHRPEASRARGPPALRA